MISMRRFFAVFKLQLYDYIRDPIAAGFSFAMPFLFLVTFGVAASTADSRISTIALVLPDNASAESMRAADVLDAEPTLRTLRMTDGQARQKLAAKDVEAIVVGGIPPQIVVRGEGERFATFLSQRLELGTYRQMVPDQSRVRPKVDILEGSARSTFEFIAPGLFALALLQLGLFGTGNQILQARSRGTLRRLKSTPLNSKEIIGAHLLVRMIIALVQMLTLALATELFFDLKIAAGLPYLIVAGVTAAITLSMLGYVMGGLAPTAQAGSMMIMVMNFYLMFCGQVFIDMRGNEIGKILTYLNPVSFAADSFRFAITGEFAALPFWTNQLIVVLWGMGLLLIALRFFKYQMEAS